MTYKHIHVFLCDIIIKVGSKRCHDLTHDLCIMPQLGSSPVVSLPGSGYYTVADYQEILSYANQRHITVIPEFDMPGHSHAAINAMEVCRTICAILIIILL